MKYTENLKLRKPDLADQGDIDIINQNSDILDQYIGELITKVNSNTTELTGQKDKAIILHNRLDKIF